MILQDYSKRTVMKSVMPSQQLNCRHPYFVYSFHKKSTVEPRYPDTLRTRKKCRQKRSVAVTGDGETCVYKKLYFL